MSGRARNVLALAAVASLVALAACGGSDGGDGAGGDGVVLDPAVTTEPDPDGETLTEPDEDEDGDENGNGEGGEDGQASASNEVAVGPSFSGRAAIDFGAQAVGAEGDPVAVVIRNFLGTPVTMTSVQIGGDHSADFAIGGTTCEPGLELGSREACEVVLVFRPSEAGERRALLLVTITGGAGAQVPLLGQGSD